MFNGGIRGKRARDGEGTTSVADNFIQTISPIPYIRNFQVAGQDDLTLDPIGGQTVIINGNGFEIGLTLSLGGVSVSPVSVVSDQLSFTAPAKAAGTYSVLIVNPSGAAAVLAPGIVYSGFPNFDTAAGNIGNFYETTAVSTSVSATADSSITYEIVSGSIPAGATFNSDGTLTGTAPYDAASTTYTFTVKATDQELQDSTREFSLTINTDVITWVYPQNNATVEISNNQPTINLSATSAAGYGVVYNVSALPAGLTLGENGEITGTVTENSQTSATLTATALTTNRVGAISVTWSVQLGDAFFNQTTLLLNADTDTFITDASDNAFTITPNGDTRPSAFSPYNTGWSNYFDGTGDYLTVPDNAAFDLPEDFTTEFFVYATAGNARRLFQLGDQRSGQNGLLIYSTTGNLIVVYVNGAVVITGPTLVPYQWVHVACVREGTGSNNLKLYVNGSLAGQVTNTVSFTGVAGNGISLGAEYNGSFAATLEAYISNFRLVKGTAVYTGNFTPPTEPLTAISGGTATYTVTNNGTGNYVIDGASNPTLTLERGGTYTFSINASGHPFWIQSVSGAYSAGNVYNSGVTNNGAQSGTLTFVVPSDAPDTLYYVCQYHSSMAGTINIISSTSLLTCQSNRLRDASTNNFTITRNGDVKVTSFAPFTDTDTSTGSGYFDGTGDYLQAASNAAFDVGTGNFTMEFWIYPLAHSALYVSRQSSSSGWENIQWWLSTDSVGTLVMAASTYGGGQNFWAGSQILLNTWTHIAIVRDSTAPNGWRIFINGTSIAYALGVGLSYSMESTTVGRPLNIGGFPGWGQTTGYIADFRFVPGTAVYTGNFTPPTASLTATQSAGTNIAAITGTSTSLLTLQNRISYNNSQPIDESGIRNIVTRVGNAGAGTFSPHVPTGWSGYFNGSTLFGHPSNAYAVWCGGTDTGFAGKTWTIETWLYITTWTSNAQNTTIIGSYQGVAANGRWVFSLGTANNSTDSARLDFTYTTSTGTQLNVMSSDDSAGKINKNQWAHVAVTIDATTASSSTIKFYVNGVLSATHTGQNLSSQTDFFDQPYIGGGCAFYNSMFGYISNFRIKRGELLTFGSLPTEPAQPDANTVYLNFRSNNFNDESGSRTAVTPNAVQITPFSPFKPHTIAPDSYSVYFDGTGDYLTIPADANRDYTGDWTVEGWFYMASGQTGNWPHMMSFKHPDNNNACMIAIYHPDKRIYSGFDGAGNINLTSNNTIQFDTWYHFVWCKSGSTHSAWVNGVRTLNQSTDTRTISSSTGRGNWYIGSYRDGGSNFKGYMSNWKVSAEALYDPADATIPVPTSPLSVSPSTDLLTLQNASFIDNSINSYSITVNGNSQPTKFNPFGETVTEGVEYAPASHGGSVYFDGTDDQIYAGANSSAFSPGTGDVTVEGWFYFTNLSAGIQNLFGCNNGSGSTQKLVAYVQTNGTIHFDITQAGGASKATSSSGQIVNGQWYHLAFVRSSGTAYIYKNGVSVASGTATDNLSSLIQPFYVGYVGEGYGVRFSGYVSNFRFVKGTALYTSAFVPPAAPADPIAGTTLLINGTNAAIQDRTGRNVLETVGNARVVNGVRKYGSGAMSFDGTGDWITSFNGAATYSLGTIYTVEMWFYTNSVAAGNAGLINLATTSGGNIGFNLYRSSAEILCNDGATGGTGPSSGVSSVSVSTWTHLAVTSDGTSTRIFLDGVLKNTYTGTTGSASVMLYATIGAFNDKTAPFQGFIDDLRITKGVARYTVDFSNNLPSSAFSLK